MVVVKNIKDQVQNASNFFGSETSIYIAVDRVAYEPTFFKNSRGAKCADLNKQVNEVYALIIGNSC